MSTQKELAEVLGAKIKVIGVGGGGGNAVNTMIRAGLEGVEFFTANTDVQSLKFSLAPNKIQIGKELTKGLGAGADPDIGRDAALEDRHEIQDSIGDADMVFITAGMGGGTGTGAAAITAQIARECGALTVAVVTKPFNFEGKRRRKHAEMGIARLRECVDTLITIPNQRLLQIATPDLSMVDAFKMADNVLVNAVKGISDIINIPGTVNVDFADVKTVMSSMGHALMGIGYASGEGRAAAAARQAICSPLLEDVDIEGATGILINITAGSTVALLEINEACSIIQESAHEDANIIFGAVIDESMGDGIRVTVIATGFPIQEADEGEIIVKPASAFPLNNPSPRPSFSTRPLVSQPRHEIRKEAFAPSSFQATTPPKVEPVAKKEPVAQTVMPQAPAAQPTAPKMAAPVAPQMQQQAPQQIQHGAPATPSPVMQAPIMSAPVAPQAPVMQTRIPNMMNAPQSFMPPPQQQVMMPPAVQPLMMNVRPPVATGVFTEEVIEEVLAQQVENIAHEAAQEVAEEVVEEVVAPQQFVQQQVETPIETAIQEVSEEMIFTSTEQNLLTEWSIEEAFSDVVPENFTVQSEPDAGKKVFPEARLEGAVYAPQDPMEEDFNELSLIAGSIEQKIDEALDLAETLGSNMQVGASADQDDLDIPAFLRMGASNLPEVKS